MYKKNIENVFEIGSHKIDTETFTLDKLSDREKKILDNAIKGGIISIIEEVKEDKTKTTKKGA